MNYNEWEKKIANLPDAVKVQIATSVNMKQPYEYVSQVTCNCTSDNFLELLADAVRAIQGNYTRVTGVQLEPVMVDGNWFSYYDGKINEIILEDDIYRRLGITAPKDFAILNKTDATVLNLLGMYLGSSLPLGYEYELVSNIQKGLCEYNDTDKIRTALAAIWGIASVLTRLPRIPRDLLFEEDEKAQSVKVFWTIDPCQSKPERVQTFQL